MTVNALMTGLIVFRIFKVFCEVKSVTTSNEKSLDVIHAGERKLCSIIFIIIESGMALFAIQLAWLVVSATGLEMDGENAVYQLIIGTHEMLNVFISLVTITLYSADNVLVWVSMGLSFHDKPSLEEAVGNLRFEAADLNPIPGMGSISLDRSLHTGPHNPNAIPEMISIKERKEDDIGGSDDIQIIDT